MRRPLRRARSVRRGAAQGHRLGLRPRARRALPVELLGAPQRPRAPARPALTPGGHPTEGLRLRAAAGGGLDATEPLARKRAGPGGRAAARLHEGQGGAKLPGPTTARAAPWTAQLLSKKGLGPRV